MLEGLTSGEHLARFEEALLKLYKKEGGAILTDFFRLIAVKKLTVRMPFQTIKQFCEINR